VAGKNILEVTENLFSLRDVCSREKGEIPDCSLQDYSSRAKLAGFLESNFTHDELQTQYRDFSASVHDNVKQNFERVETFKEKIRIEHDFYNKLIHGKYRGNEFPEVTHLAASATIRLSNECQVESMASVVGRHSEGRGSLDPKTLNKECFISWNGPPPTSQANKMIDRALKRRFNGGPEK